MLNVIGLFSLTTSIWSFSSSSSICGHDVIVTTRWKRCFAHLWCVVTLNPFPIEHESERRGGYSSSGSICFKYLLHLMWQKFRLKRWTGACTDLRVLFHFEKHFIACLLSDTQSDRFACSCVFISFCHLLSDIITTILDYFPLFFERKHLVFLSRVRKTNLKKTIIGIKLNKFYFKFILLVLILIPLDVKLFNCVFSSSRSSSSRNHPARYLYIPLPLHHCWKMAAETSIKSVRTVAIHPASNLCSVFLNLTFNVGFLSPSCALPPFAIITLV